MATQTGAGGLSSLELKLCREALEVFKSDEHSKKNFLFLVPVDTTFHPTYLDIIKKPMDLRTLGENLEAGKYNSRDEFFADTMLIFDNALKFHQNNRDMQWVIKLAKDMMKLATKEKRAAEKKFKEAGGSNKKGAKKQTKKASAPKAKAKKSDGDNKKEGAKTIKLKLSTGGVEKGKVAVAPSTVPNSSSVSSATTSKPKVSLKLKLPSSKGEGEKKKPKVAKAGATKAKKEKTKPRLKLSLSSKATTTSVPIAAPDVTTATATSGSDPAPKPATNKVQVRLSAPSRGKELPKGVDPSPDKQSKKKANAKKSELTKAKATAKTVAKSSAKTSAKTSSKTSTKPSKKITITAPKQKISISVSGSAPAVGVTTAPMNPKRKAQCMKVLSGLKRRQAKEIIWFLHPVADKAIVDDYNAKIPFPMDLGTMTAKLEKNEYKTVDEFVLDLRRIFGNCLRYNTTIRDSFRPVAVAMLSTVEQLLAYFIGKPEAPAVVYPPLLYCWKLCISIIDGLLNITNPTDGHQTAHYFLHPVAFYFGGTVPPDYSIKVKKPMDLGTITSLLCEAQVQSVSSFSADCQLVIENCMSYYGGNQHGAIFTEQAGRLRLLMSQQLEALLRYDKSPNGVAERAKVVTWASVNFAKPSPDFLVGIIKDLRATKYTDKLTKIQQPTMCHFEKPVDLVHFPDYLKFVETPIDLESIELKAKDGFYETPEDFEYDVNQIFRNSEKYNVPKRNQLMVAMTKYAAKTFRKLFASKMKALEFPETAEPSKESGTKDAKAELKRRPSLPSLPQESNKKPRVDPEASSTGGKMAPRISLSISAAATAAASRSKSPKTAGGSSSIKKKSQEKPGKPDQAVPLHVAIAQVKEKFPLRRPYKLLQSWEGACARFFRELMKHPWISAARPKFIFHVPVPVLFPELKEAYSAKIQRPMDLTTAEAKLLQGGLYYTAQEFVNEVALVFANAITFNKAGHDVGEPMSCAYYDASIHLLKYTRWLSLEFLSEYLSDNPDPDLTQSDIPPTFWKLSKVNKKKAREEMETIVISEAIEKSFEGDRYTWMEAECEKLLKALRHQSDFKFMSFFIQPNYPADYAAFISRPMDWQRVQRTLQQRKYDTISDIVADLRLIFSNALKYNARAKDFDPVSARAYDSAIYMSKKLEAAIDKMMLSVADRLERERIDHVTAEREIEAVERAEEERMRAMWSKGKAASGSSEPQTRVETIETVRVVTRRPAQRKEMMDFESLFNEEEDGSHEQSHVDSQKQLKSLFERQRQARVKMRRQTMLAGSLVFKRLGGRAQVIAAMIKAKEQEAVAKADAVGSCSSSGDTKLPQTNMGSSIQPELNKEGRPQIIIKTKLFQEKVPKKRKKKKKQKLITFDD